MSEDFDFLWDARHEALYRIELSRLYHRSRERFFDVMDRLAKGVAVIGGAVAFASFGGTGFVRFVAALITITSTLALVCGLGERARRHADLAAKFAMLEAEIVSCGEHGFSEQNIKRWSDQIRALESSEPAALRALVTLCQNRIAVAQAQPENIVVLPLYQRLFAHFWDFTPQRV